MAILTRRSTAALAACILTTAGCDLLREPTPLDPLPQEVAVHAVLRAGSDTVRVLITRGSIGSGGDLTFRPVSDADVRLRGPQGEAILSEATPGAGACVVNHFDLGQTEPLADAEPGCYTASLPAAVAAGERYELRIVLPDGDGVRGDAVVPEPTAFALPSPPGARMQVRTGEDSGDDPVRLTLLWTRGVNAVTTAFSLRHDTVYSGGSAVADVRCYVAYGTIQVEVRAAGGEAVLSVGGVDCSALSDPDDPYSWVPVDWDSIRAYVRATGYDQAYSQYTVLMLQGESSAPRDWASAGLTGAVGVFGAVTPVDVPLTLVRDRP